MNNNVIGELIGRGRTADVYKYGESRVLKLYHKNIERSIVEYEYSINLIINDLNISTPKAYAIFEKDNRLGIVYDEVKGNTLASTVLTSKDISYYGKMIAKLHLSLHSCEVNNLPDGKSRLIKNIKDQTLLDKEIRDELLENLNRLPKSNKLCHGDFHIDNILEDGEKLTIIDWIDAYRGYPLLDVARTYLIMLTPYLLTLVDKKLASSVKEIQKILAEKYLNYYLENSVYERDSFDVVLRVVAAGRLKEQVPFEREWLLTLIK